MSEIFLSYSSEDKEFVNLIDDYAKILGVLLTRDQRDLKVGDDIDKFARRIRKPNKSIVVVSKNFLESEACMYEVVEAFRDFYEDEESDIRIIVVNDQKDPVILKEPCDDKKYVEFWNKKSDDQATLINNIGTANAAELTEQAKRNEKITMIKNNIPKFLSFVRKKLYITSDSIKSEGIYPFAKLLKQLASTVEIPQTNSRFEYTIGEL